MENSLIPTYGVVKFNFSDEEKLILEELRENLIDLAISEKMSSFNEELILKDIIRFLENRLQNYSSSTLYANKMKENSRFSYIKYI